MINRRIPLKDRVIIRLTTDPQSFRMSQFSQQTTTGKLSCLAGTILDECGVGFVYSPRGVAIGLKKGVTPPSQKWIAYELSISAGPTRVDQVKIAAKARELWAAEHGDFSAERLPFYGPDWEVKTSQLDTITADRVVEFLQIISLIAAEVAAAN